MRQQIIDKMPAGNGQTLHYGFRAVWVLTYLFLLPKTLLTAVIFSTGLGLIGDATLSPTSGLVSENFAIQKVATLIGVLFFAHQHMEKHDRHNANRVFPKKESIII